MGIFQSRPSPQSQLRELNKLRDKMESQLPWIALGRNGAAGMLAAATVSMSAAVTTLLPQGSTLAGILLFVSVILQLVSNESRDPIIRGINRILDTNYQDKSKLKLKEGWLRLTLLIFIEAFGYLFGIEPPNAGFEIRIAFAALILLFCTCAYIKMIVIQDKNDYYLRDACNSCDSALQLRLHSDENV